MSDIAEEALREQIKPLIEQATLAHGAGATDIQIAELAVRLALATDPYSKAMTHAIRILTAQRFRVERVESLRLEENTKRGIVRFTSPITPKSRKGWDELRTDPIWTEEGREMFNRLKASIGHGGVVFKLVEDAGVFPPGAKNASGEDMEGQPRKSRVIVYFIDQGEQAVAAGVGVDPTVPQGRAEADSGPAPSRVAHEEPYDLMPVHLTPSTVLPNETPASLVSPAKAGPSPEQIRAVGEDWKRDESVVPAGSPTEQRNRILDLAQHIGRADARELASAAVGYDVSTLIVPELRSAADAAKVIVALQNAWNDLQVQRKQAAS